MGRRLIKYEHPTYPRDKAIFAIQPKRHGGCPWISVDGACEFEDVDVATTFLVNCLGRLGYSVSLTKVERMERR